MKKCKICKKEFEQFSSLHVACSPNCALTLTKQNKKKTYDKETKRLRVKFKHNDRKRITRLAQQAFNAYIRKRDGNRCISCGIQTRVVHAGHFISVGHGGSGLRFHPDNCHTQCVKCNMHLSGNIQNYRIGLQAKIGLDRVEALESTKEPKKYTLDELREIAAEYKQKLARMTSPEAR